MSNEKCSVNNHNVKRLHHALKNDNLDVLWMGNSYCYSSIDPSLFPSINSYNLGVATASVTFNKLLFDNYYSNVSTPPKYVAICYSRMNFVKKSDNFIDYPIHYYLDSPINNLSLLQNSWINLQDYFYLTQKKAKEIIYRCNSDGYDIPENNYKGFYTISDTVDAKKIVSQWKYYSQLSKEEFMWSKFDATLEFADSLKSLGIKVFFFEPPTFLLEKLFSKSFNRDYITSKEKLLKKFILIEEEMANNQDHFRNIDHMNTAGSRVYSNFVNERLKKMKIIKVLE